MSELRLDGYVEGDIVQMRRTGKVVRVADGYVEMKDVQSGHRFGVSDAQAASSVRLEMVKRAARPRPKQGDVITGQQVQDIPWKRGTIFRLVTFDDGTPVERPRAGLVLREDGKLHALDNETAGLDVFEFSDLNPYAEFELRYVA